MEIEAIEKSEFATQDGKYFGLFSSSTRDQTANVIDAFTDTPTGSKLELPPYSTILVDQAQILDKKVILDAQGSTLVQTSNKPVLKISNRQEKTAFTLSLVTDYVAPDVNAATATEVSVLTSLTSAPDPTIWHRGRVIKIGADQDFDARFGASSSGAKVGEVATVLQTDGNDIYLQSKLFFHDDYPASVFATPFAENSNHVIENLVLDSPDYDETYNLALLDMYNAQGASFRNVVTKGAPGIGLGIRGCVHTRIKDTEFNRHSQNALDDQYGYGIAVVSSHYTQIEGIVGHDLRHLITTVTGDISVANEDPSADSMAHYGATHHLFANNIVATGCNGALDVHELAFRVRYSNFDISQAQAGASFAGVNIRGHDVKLRNGYIHNCRRGIVAYSTLEGGVGTGVEIYKVTTRDIEEVALSMALPAARQGGAERIPAVRTIDCDFQANQTQVVSASSGTLIDRNSVFESVDGILEDGIGILTTHDSANVYLNGTTITAENAANPVPSLGSTDIDSHVYIGPNVELYEGNFAGGAAQAITGNGHVEYTTDRFKIGTRIVSIADYGKTLRNTFGGLSLPMPFSVTGRVPRFFYVDYRNDQNVDSPITLQTGVVLTYIDGTDAAPLVVKTGDTVRLMYDGRYESPSVRPNWVVMPIDIRSDGLENELPIFDPTTSNNAHERIRFLFEGVYWIFEGRTGEDRTVAPIVDNGDGTFTTNTAEWRLLEHNTALPWTPEIGAGLTPFYEVGVHDIKHVFLEANGDRTFGRYGYQRLITDVNLYNVDPADPSVATHWSRYS